MNKTQKIIAIILGVLALAGIATTILIIIKTQEPEETVAKEPAFDCPRVDGIITYNGEEDKTVLEILQSICETATTTSVDDIIITVIAIDGFTATAPDFWALYINDLPALKSPNNIPTVETDTIKWQLESLGN